MRTALICTSPPASFVTLAEVKAQLRVSGTADDALIQAMIDAACGALDGGDGILKRAIGAQTLKLVLPGFCPSPPRAQGIVLPLPPATAVSNIKYFDGDGVEQTLDPAAYRLIDCDTQPSYLVPVASWPSAACRPDAVSITYTAGYDAVPPPIKQAVILMVKQQYDLGQRNAFLASSQVEGVGQRSYFAEGSGNLIDQAAQNLLNNYRLVNL
jgi:uncharacterized phiE125 gp8 family phage protein